MLLTTMAEDPSAVESFADSWQLDDRSREYLKSLSPVAQQTVIADFSPREGTQNISGKLLAFAKTVADQHQGEDADGLQDFIEKWSLDHDVVGWLRGLPRSVIEVILNEFDPKEDTRDIVGKLKGFARSVQGRCAAKEHAPGGSRRQLEEFCNSWGAQASLGFLRRLPADVQMRVIKEFAPRGDTVNINGKLQSFAMSVNGASSRSSSDQLLAEFENHWSLNQASHQLLVSLPEDALKTVISEFEPRSDTKDVDGKLRQFAHGILQRGGGSLRQPAPAAGVRRQSPRGNAYNTAASVANFLRHWDLQQDAAELLESLPQAALDIVLQEFEPRADTRNLMGKLHSFASTVLVKQGLSPLPGGSQASRSSTAPAF